MKTFKEIQALYPYQFAGRNIGFGIANGWLPLFGKLCEDLDQVLGPNKRGFHWVQLKEKFGSARFYWEMSGVQKQVFVDLIRPDGVTTFSNSPKARAEAEDEVVKKINELVSTATSKTNSMCIVCGQEGKADNFEYYTLVLCAKHKLARHEGADLDIWPEEEGEEE